MCKYSRNSVHFHRPNEGKFKLIDLDKFWRNRGDFVLPWTSLNYHSVLDAGALAGTPIELGTQCSQKLSRTRVSVSWNSPHAVVPKTSTIQKFSMAVSATCLQLIRSVNRSIPEVARDVLKSRLIDTATSKGHKSQFMQQRSKKLDSVQIKPSAVLIKQTNCYTIPLKCWRTVQMHHQLHEHSCFWKHFSVFVTGWSETCRAASLARIRMDLQLKKLKRTVLLHAQRTNAHACKEIICSSGSDVSVRKHQTKTLMSN